MTQSLGDCGRVRRCDTPCLLPQLAQRVASSSGVSHSRVQPSPELRGAQRAPDTSAPGLDYCISVICGVGWSPRICTADPATAATITALAVSITAMAVVLAQGVQQYLITRELICMCDGVVYEKMLGQGMRVWEYVQFHF